MKRIEGYDVKIFTDNIEELALTQIRKLLSIDVFSDKKIRIMPDVHAGIGCVIGFTGNLGDKVIPNIVGVDIGCGMRVMNLGKVGDIDYHAFHEHIKRRVPSGISVRNKGEIESTLTGENMEIYHQAKDLISHLHCQRELIKEGHLWRSIGTLGGGNHFIELDRSEGGDLYLVIHTGSRNLGKQVADIYQRKAVTHMTPCLENLEENIQRTVDEYKAAGRCDELKQVVKEMRKQAKEAKPTLKHDLCYVEGDDRERYLHDMRLCQRWAELNRQLIGNLLLEFFGDDATTIDVFETIHNYISADNMIRKGAISAAKGERCIIPLNMRDGSLICRGKGNEDWNCSAPHGAGRVMSRTKAYETIDMADFQASMQGIYSESVNLFTRDECPMVYKPAEEIMANIGETVDIENIIRPVFNFKAGK